MIKVVVVDDDTDLLEMVCLMLRTPKISPICLEDGEEVVPILQIVRPNVLVMDIFLGKYDGRELCKQIKAMAEYSGLPVLLYSAADVERDSITSSGADDFIRKPFDMSELIGKIEALGSRA